MMEIDAVKIRRVGGDNDPNAKVVVSVCVTGLSTNCPGEWVDIGEEQLSSCFSHIFELPHSVHYARSRTAAEQGRAG